ARAHRHDAGRRHRVRPARRPAHLRGRRAHGPAVDHPGRGQPVAQGEDRPRRVPGPAGGLRGPGPRHPRARRAALETLPFDDTRDFEDAARGFVATLPEVEIKNAQGRVVWSLRDYAFLARAEAPPTVNPSLWRQARLNLHHGLFQVTERVYQVRGFDLSDMTLIEGERGVIVVDPLISTEVARAGLDLYRAHRGDRPVTAVIYSHSHTDHYGGVRGVLDEAEVAAGLVPVVAPARFMEEVVSEA